LKRQNEKQQPRTRREAINGDKWEEKWPKKLEQRNEVDVTKKSKAPENVKSTQ